MINKTDQSTWDHKIIFAPNATGKTTLCNNLWEDLRKSCNVEIMTAKNIKDLIELKRGGIFIGKAAKNLGENEKIEEELKSEKILDEIFDKYFVKNATELSKKSYTFSYYIITNGKISDFLKRIDFKHNDFEKSNIFVIDYEDAFYLDQLLTKGEYDLLVKFKNDNDIYNILKTTKISGNTISKENFNYLNIIKQTIGLNNTICPLCGTEFSDNNTLINSIDKYFSDYTISDSKIIFDSIDLIWSKLILNKDKFDLGKYSINIRENLNYSQKLFELLKLNDLFDAIRYKIIDWINEKLEKRNIFNKVNIYKDNQKYIEEEKDRIKNRQEYYLSIIEDFKKLVNLPNELEIKIFENTFLLFDKIKQRNLNPSDSLSESEIKRLALVVLKNQIIYANLDYLIFDDPIDSYDDYFLKRASKYIAEIINDNKNLKWTICSHVFEFVDILNKNINSNIIYENIFYFFDPSYKYNEQEKPKLLMKVVARENISAITEHEIVIIKKMFSKDMGYKMDTSFALLGAATTTRNSIIEIIPIYNVVYHQSKVYKNTCHMENRYIHYSNFKNYYMHELFSIYKKIYSEFKFDISDLKNVNVECSDARGKILAEDYNNIYAENELLKAIFYNIIRVSYCKQLIEKKIIYRMEKFDYPSSDISRIFRKNGLGSKLKTVLQLEEQLGKKSNFDEINNVYLEFDSIVRDFSHGTIRMFPPYLSINSFDISKFENYIQNIS